MPKGLDQRQALLVLNGLSHVGPVLLRRLMEIFDGDAAAVLSSTRKQLLGVKGVGDKAVDTLLAWEQHFNLDRELKQLEQKAAHFITQTCAGYPQILRETYDPPIGLYWHGEYKIDRPCVAIVGTRKATLYGLGVAKRFASELARLGFCIVSGMARGTDSAAHRGALLVGGKTVAVLGCGLDIIYPSENLDLYNEIAAKGAVVSEFPFGRRVDRQTFPMRNRVVAGMSEAVIVIESDKAGGSMITARFAGEQGRTLMAVPGRIDQASSAGCHQLIRDGAIMVTSVDDILEELRYAKPLVQNLDFEAEATPVDHSLPDAEQAIMDAFRGGEILSPDVLAERLSKPVSEISALLMGLELKHLLAKRADGCFEAK